ncbi:hypothetical protein [Lactobacillus sp.]|uniref:hypothetical protein n=1 Tax=Lactobacillus sp. TaxID=1591 RepID=UPI0019CD0DBA|nr:hypothetical protein [Lactobacillus sp.]MBD5429325.1 hypothetical protein [Lactobacillus sp.]
MEKKQKIIEALEEALQDIKEKEVKSIVMAYICDDKVNTLSLGNEVDLFALPQYIINNIQDQRRELKSKETFKKLFLDSLFDSDGEDDE